MDPSAESRSFGTTPHGSSSVFSYSSLPTAVDENASELGYNPSILSIDEDNADGSDPLQSCPGSEPGETYCDPTSTPFKPAVIPVAEQMHPESPSAIWKMVFSRWYPEILWCTFSTGCFLALVLILTKYNEEPLPKWPLGLTLNTAIALLATLSRTGFVLPVCECISQLKWLWYRKERPLADLQTFDEASRGPWGSLKLLMTMRTKAWVLALLPALVMTTSVLTSTLTQSVVTYPTRLDPVYGLPIPTLVLGRNIYMDSYNVSIYKTISEVNTGFNYPIEDELDINRPSCATSECQWPLFDTLEVCTKTWNITQDLDFETKEERVVNISLPNGAFWDIPDPMYRPGYTWLFNSHGPVSDGAKSSTITNNTFWSFIATYIGSKDSLFAVEVAFHLCVNRYNLTVKENVVSRQQTASSTKTGYGPVTIDFSGQVADMHYILSPGDKPTKFPFALRFLKNALELVFNGTSDINYFEDAHPATLLTYLFQTALYDELSGVSHHEDGPVMGVMKNVSRNIAASLSRGITTGNSIAEKNRIDNRVEGENLGPVVFVKVRWPWLIFLGSQILLSLIFVAIVIARTALSNLGATKSSMLPVLFAISPEERAVVEKRTEANEYKYHQEFKEIADRATGVVGMFSPGIKGRGWILRHHKGEM